MSMPDMGSMRFQQQAADTQQNLLDYLLEKYGESGAPQDEVSHADHFVQWAKRQLGANRPVGSFPADLNSGVILEDNTYLLVAPATGVESQGQMMKTPLSPEQRQGIPDVYADQGAVPVSGKSKRPQGSTDYRQYDERNFERKQGQGDDKTVQQPNRDMRRESGGNL
jgi:hypothetical protein